MRGRTIAIAALAAALAGTGAAVAVPGDALIHGCVGPQGKLRVVGAETKCRPSERAISWNEKGIAGPAGPQGDRGVPGPAGPQGDRGAAGPAGPQGETGARGPAGPRGLVGPAGAKGDTGAVGPRGAKGDTGPAGADGSALLGTGFLDPPNERPILTRGVVPTFERLGVGSYRMTFDGTGPGCGLPHLTLAGAPGFITYGGGQCGGLTQTFVTIRHHDGFLADLPFTYLVIGPNQGTGAAASQADAPTAIPESGRAGR